MKRITIFYITIAVCILLLSGCSGEVFTTKLSTQDIIHLSEEKKLEDFTYLVDTMNALYPFWGEVEELGINKEELINKYYDLIPDTANGAEFLNTILDYFKDLKAYSLGHLSPLSPNAYYDFVDIYVNNDLKYCKSWEKLLTNPRTKSMYATMDPTASIFMLKEKSEQTEAGTTFNTPASTDDKPVMYTEIINDGKTAYIKIPTFNGLLIKEELPQIISFTESLGEIDDLIIDIRGNSGGSDSYWMDGIVSPNITEDKTYSTYYLLKDELLASKEVKPFWKERHKKHKQYPINELPEFTNLSPYAKDFDYFTYSRTIVPANPSSNPFTGDIWVLVDKRNGSASASFTEFCLENDFATLVGEASGGDNCHGDPVLFAMPNSGMVFRFDLFYGLNPDGTSNAVSGAKPDIPCASEDALEVCLEAINQ